jgi:hypothetical protein
MTNSSKTKIPDIAGIMEGTLRRFNYLNETERKMAFEYRQHEVRGWFC